MAGLGRRLQSERCRILGHRFPHQVGSAADVEGDVIAARADPVDVLGEDDLDPGARADDSYRHTGLSLDYKPLEQLATVDGNQWIAYNKKMKPLLVQLVLAAGLAAAVAAGNAVAAPPFGARDMAAVAQWKGELHAADEALRAGSWEKGRDRAQETLHSMQESMEGGDGMGPLLAMAELLAAVGEEGTGRSDEAFWDWLTADNLNPAVGGVNLTVYGDAGARLHERIASELTLPSGLEHSPGSLTESPWVAAHMRHGVVDLIRQPRRGDSAQAKPPQRVMTPPPEYPRAMRKACAAGRVVIETMLDATGKVETFHIRESAGAPFDLAALQAIHAWRFSPAVLRDKPVPVIYQLDVNFYVEGCTQHH
jgi:TonB family protein